MAQLGVQGGPAGLTHFDANNRPHLYFDIGVPHFDASVIPHELLHLYEDFATLDSFTTEKFEQMVAKFPNLRGLSVPHVLDEGTVGVLADRLSGRRHLAASRPEYRGWAEIVQKLIDRHGEKDLLAVILQSDKFEGKPKARLVALDKVLGQLNEVMAAPTRTSEL